MDDTRYSLGRLLVDRGVITDEQLEAALSAQRSGGGKLGEILTDRGWVSPLSVAAAVAKQRVAESGPPESEQIRRSPRVSNWKPLGSFLLEKNLISEVQLKQGLALQRDNGGFLGEILVQQGWLSAADLVLALAAQLGLDFDVRRAVESSDDASLLPSQRPTAHFEVLEGVDDEVKLLTTVDTFMEATDYVFDEVLWQREPGELQIVRVEGERREVVWSHKPQEAAAHQREDLLSVFGYHVGQWQDKHAEASDGSVAAGGS